MQNELLMPSLLIFACAIGKCFITLYLLEKNRREELEREMERKRKYNR